MTKPLFDEGMCFKRGKVRNTVDCGGGGGNSAQAEPQRGGRRRGGKFKKSGLPGGDRITESLEEVSSPR